ncbi:unnamed protein product, partial [Meganyctiphanes norvegica]
LSDEIEEVMISVRTGRVATAWRGRSYPTLKGLGSYITDLLQRLKFLQGWYDNGQPRVFWISGFFFTQSFLTAVLQNHARKHVIAIDMLAFNFVMVEVSEDSPQPEMGSYIRGLFLEGACWDKENKRLDEAKPRRLHENMPEIWLHPMELKDIPNSRSYLCPCYKTAERRGTLMTTGHCTNFIFNVNIPTHLKEDHWILRGVALICALTD